MAARRENATGAAGLTGAAAAADVTDMIDLNEPLNDAFLLELAKKSGAKFTQLGIYMGITSDAVEQIKFDCSGDSALINFTILKTWRENVKARVTHSVMYDTLCEALLNFQRTDLHDFVRSEQVRNAGAQRTTVDEQLASGRQALQDEINRLKQEKAQCKAKAEEEIQRLSEEIESLKMKMPSAIAADEVKAAAQPSKNESSEDSKRRKLRVISLLRKHQVADLWTTVSDQILENGKLDISNITISVQVLQDMTYLFNSGAANNVSSVNLDKCRLPSSDELADLLAAAGRLSELSELRLAYIDLHGRPMSAVADNIDHWPRLKELGLGLCNLDDTDVGRLVTTLSSATSLEVLGLGHNYINDDTARRVTETAVTLSALHTLSLVNNWLSKAGVARLRDAVRQTPRVWLRGVDWQRPQGQGLVHPDPVVVCQRRVDQVQSALTRLRARPLAARDQWWGKDEAWLQGWLDRLREAKAE